MIDPQLDFGYYEQFVSAAAPYQLDMRTIYADDTEVLLYITLTEHSFNITMNKPTKRIAGVKIDYRRATVETVLANIRGLKHELQYTD